MPRAYVALTLRQASVAAASVNSEAHTLLIAPSAVAYTRGPLSARGPDKRKLPAGSGELPPVVRMGEGGELPVTTYASYLWPHVIEFNAYTGLFVRIAYWEGVVMPWAREMVPQGVLRSQPLM